MLSQINGSPPPPPPTPPTQDIEEPTQRTTPRGTSQENPATTQGRGFDPHSEPTMQKPSNWKKMSRNAKEHWLRTQRKKEGEGRPVRV